MLIHSLIFILLERDDIVRVSSPGNNSFEQNQNTNKVVQKVKLPKQAL